MGQQKRVKPATGGLTLKGKNAARVSGRRQRLAGDPAISSPSASTPTLSRDQILKQLADRQHADAFGDLAAILSGASPIGPTGPIGNRQLLAALRKQDSFIDYVCTLAAQDMVLAKNALLAGTTTPDIVSEFVQTQLGLDSVAVKNLAPQEPQEVPSFISEGQSFDLPELKKNGQALKCLMVEKLPHGQAFVATHEISESQQKTSKTNIFGWAYAASSQPSSAKNIVHNYTLFVPDEHGALQPQQLFSRAFEGAQDSSAKLTWLPDGSGFITAFRKDSVDQVDHRSGLKYALEVRYYASDLPNENPEQPGWGYRVISPKSLGYKGEITDHDLRFACNSRHIMVYNRANDFRILELDAIRRGAASPGVTITPAQSDPDYCDYRNQPNPLVAAPGDDGFFYVHYNTEYKIATISHAKCQPDGTWRSQNLGTTYTYDGKGSNECLYLRVAGDPGDCHPIVSRLESHTAGSHTFLDSFRLYTKTNRDWEEHKLASILESTLDDKEVKTLGANISPDGQLVFHWYQKGLNYGNTDSQHTGYFLDCYRKEKSGWKKEQINHTPFGIYDSDGKSQLSFHPPIFKVQPVAGDPDGLLINSSLPYTLEAVAGNKTRGDYPEGFDQHNHTQWQYWRRDPTGRWHPYPIANLGEGCHNDIMASPDGKTLIAPKDGRRGADRIWTAGSCNSNFAESGAKNLISAGLATWQTARDDDPVSALADIKESLCAHSKDPNLQQTAMIDIAAGLAATNRWPEEPTFAADKTATLLVAHATSAADLARMRALREQLGPDNDLYIELFPIEGCPAIKAPTALGPEAAAHIPTMPHDYYLLPQMQGVHIALALSLAAPDQKNRHVFLKGPPGVGKTEVCRYIANKLQLPFHLVPCCGQTDLSDLLGTFGPGKLRYNEYQIARMEQQDIDTMRTALHEDAGWPMDSLIAMDLETIRNACNEAAKPQFTLGPVAEAFKNGGLVVLDEADTLQPRVLVALHNALDGSGTLQVNNETIKIHEDCKIILTGNGSKYRGRRNLTAALKSRLTILEFPEWAEEDYISYATRAFGDKMPAELIEKLVATHLTFVTKSQEKPLSREVADLFFTPRQLIAVGKQWQAFRARSLSNEALLCRELIEVYTGAIYKDEIREGLESTIYGMFAPKVRTEVEDFYHKLTLTHDNNILVIGDVRLPKRGLTGKFVPEENDDKILATRRTLVTLYHLAKCRALNKPALLVGERGCGKTAIIKYLGYLLGDPVYQLCLNRETDINAVVGSYNSSGFEHGPFLRATNVDGPGGTLVLDEFNCSPPSVQAFFNGYFNGEREITIPQLGTDKWHIHPESHVVICVNPATANYESAQRFDAASVSRMLARRIKDPDLEELTAIFRYKGGVLAKDIVETFAKQHPGLLEGTDALVAEFHKAAARMVATHQALKTLFESREVVVNGTTYRLHSFSASEQPDFSIRKLDRAIGSFQAMIVLSIGQQSYKNSYKNPFSVAYLSAVKKEYLFPVPQRDQQNRKIVNELINVLMSADRGS